MSIKTALHTQWTAKFLAAASTFENGSSHALKKVARIEMRAYEEGLRLLHTWVDTAEVATSLRRRMNSPMRRSQRPFFISMLYDLEIALDRGDEPKAVQ